MIESEVKPLENIGLAAHSYAGDFRTSYELAARCIREEIPGDFVECGVFAGAQCAAMAKAIIDSYTADPSTTDTVEDVRRFAQKGIEKRRVHLFDSFEGVPAPGPQDQQWIAAGHEVGISGCTVEGVKANMRQWGIPDELLVYHPGVFRVDESGAWFEKRAAQEIGDFRIALLRIDLDLYEGTLSALKLFYPDLVPGGFCVIDDYGLDGCRQAVNEFMGGGFPPITWQKQA